MRLDEILAKPISSSVSYDPEAKKLKLKGNKPRMTLKVISRIKHIRKLHDRKQEKRVKFLGALYGNPELKSDLAIAIDKEDKTQSHIDDLAMNYVKKSFDE